MKRPIVIVIALIIGLAALWLYYDLQPLPNIETKGEGTPTTAWISLAVSIISLLTALVGLIQRIIEARAAKASS